MISMLSSRHWRAAGSATCASVGRGSPAKARECQRVGVELRAISVAQVLAGNWLACGPARSWRLRGARQRGVVQQEGNFRRR